MFWVRADRETLAKAERHVGPLSGAEIERQIDGPWVKLICATRLEAREVGTRIVSAGVGQVDVGYGENWFEQLRYWQRPRIVPLD